MYELKVAYSSDTGVKRKNNQDSYLAADITKDGQIFYLFAVADGLGGHQSGEVASRMAIDYIKNNFYKIEDFDNYKEVNDFVNEINRSIIYESSQNPEMLGMATTLTMAVICNDNMVIYHVGDSRCYRINSEEIEQLTKDHSLVQALVDQGRITVEEAKTHPQKNVITRALGTDETVKTDLYEYRLYRGDTILLCSDGLYNMVPVSQIHKIVMENDLEEAAKKLVNLANYNGGIDNITVIICSPGEEVNQ